MTIKSASNNLVNVISKVRLSVQLSDLHVCVYSGVVEEFVAPLLIVTLFIDRYVKGIFAMG